MKIAIATAGLEFTGNTLETKALGGSETAVISVAKALAKRGNQVRVFCECPNPGTFDGVEYYNRSQFVPQTTIIPFDVLIACRWSEFLATPSISGIRVLWLHDMPVDRSSFMPTLWQCDLVMGLSDFHIDQYCNQVAQLRPHFWKTANGVDAERITKLARPKDPNKLIYTSRPERGLLPLLSGIFPKLLSVNPNLRLYYCTYKLDGTMKLQDSVKRIHDACDYFASQLGNHVVNMGSLPKDSLYQQITSAKLQLYPTAFPEIFCIAMAEAAAAGTPHITTDDFALSETVGPGGIKIKGSPETVEYQEQFVSETLRLLSDDVAYKEKVDAGKKWIVDQGYTWDAVAAAWEAKFAKMLDEKVATVPAKIVKELVRQNSLVPAKLSAKRHNLPELEAEIDERIKKVELAEYDAGDIADRYAKSTDRFQKVCQLLGMQKKPVKSLLDYDCDDVALGLTLPRLMSDVAVTLCARTPEIAERLKVYVEKTGVAATVVTEVPKDTTYDVVYTDCRIEYKADPQEFLRTIQRKYLNDGGFIAFSTRFGEDRTRYAEDSKQLWNFDCDDIEAMLKQDGNVYNLTFHDERARPVFEGIHGCWIAVCNKTKNLGKFDIQTKFRRTRPYQKLTGCIIAKNSEFWMPFCLQPLRDICDEIVVVDTGSSDGTIVVARNYGARVVETEFDNFSQARNFGIDSIEDTDWILTVDTDERLSHGDQIRKYLHSTIFEALILKQKHLSLDVEKVSYDVPIRIWKNKPHYRYTGFIHEHVEDVSVKPFDQELQPALILPDAELGHFGYENENQRRTKCSRRNLELLIRDMEENGSKGRLLSWVLVMRDYLNMTKWALEKKGKLASGSTEHEFMVAAVTTYQHFFADGSNKYCEMARKIYEDCLMVMAAAELVYPGKRHPPFQVCLTLAGAVGGMDPKKGYQPSYFWFLDDDEFFEFVKKKSVDMLVKMGISSKDKFESELLPKKPEHILPLPDARKLLSRGLHAM